MQEVRFHLFLFRDCWSAYDSFDRQLRFVYLQFGAAIGGDRSGFGPGRLSKRSNPTGGNLGEKTQPFDYFPRPVYAQ